MNIVASKLPRVDIPLHYRQLGTVDIGRLLPRVIALTEEDWLKGTRGRRNAFPGLEQTKTINLRFVENLDDPLTSYSLPDFEDWKALLCPICDQAIVSYGYKDPQLSKVMLTQLPAGTHIKPHTDARAGNLYTHKIHVPLVTHRDVLFYSRGVPFHIPLGEAWEVNNVDMHSVWNQSRIDRVHLIFEIYDAALIRA
ncbi:aspartyl/asparaginyl beta-hydroxylase domain-containing protein [Halocynthiibacter namhaensis]|uniref:aspartyl/asparaginyl beta-hydroxylase domain-containing protein n=1 Tax=Halocynthiibacter namhaensis TaxID=1290553 RepID=UPI00068E78C7|nr:aspartyl/asparaginyl beta-hydroxylase domain-containing protein [Halocynthiibacter namhaensis]